MNENQLAVVIFGRPGAGKTTIAKAAVRLLDDDGGSGSKACQRLYLDLDVCVPQWMRDNFSKGIYPTLTQRADFIRDACKYVEREIGSASKNGNGGHLVAIISFSFVNTDLREAFREKFPEAHWILVDTHKRLAEERIATREGHFYKTTSSASVESNGDTNDAAKEAGGKRTDDDNSEWEFRPVDFPHVVLDGRDAVETNAKRIVEFVERMHS